MPDLAIVMQTLSQPLQEMSVLLNNRLLYFEKLYQKRVRSKSILSLHVEVQFTHLIAASRAKLDAQHIFRMNISSLVCLMHSRYGFNLAASDL